MATRLPALTQNNFQWRDLENKVTLSATVIQENVKWASPPVGVTNSGVNKRLGLTISLDACDTNGVNYKIGDIAVKVNLPKLDIDFIDNNTDIESYPPLIPANKNTSFSKTDVKDTITDAVGKVLDAYW